MEFRDKVIKIRELLFISQESLAKELEVSFATINRLENGHTKPSLITKARIDNLCKKKGICFDEEGGDTQ
jgi:DNA-binding XRE family transcriptional regulator